MTELIIEILPFLGAGVVAIVLGTLIRKKKPAFRKGYLGLYFIALAFLYHDLAWWFRLATFILGVLIAGWDYKGNKKAAA